MSYEVLARKWRPRQFDELVGQEHVVKALANGLDHDRLHHAYLFTGTRGVGKTTLARIFAKSLNCERGISSTPCGECATCRELDEGRFVDLLEVDAASRTKVDQTRELLENVPYAPARGRYKVYLIDEVHMFSDSSFNALLKTLEEPPPHVKFLLATTDPQKVPMTVLSRCLQFSLKRLTPEQIAQQLEHILGAEKIDFEPPALALLAHGADGSMRDGLSLLDQAIAFSGGQVNDRDVRVMLGTVSRGVVLGLLDALAARDGRKLLQETARLAEGAPDFVAVLGEMLRLFHRIAVVQTVPDAPLDDVVDSDAIAALAHRLLPEDVQLYYEIGLQGQRNLAHAPDPRSGLEMILLRMLAFQPDAAAQESSTIPTAAARPPGPAPTRKAAPERRVEHPPPDPTVPTAAPSTTGGIDDWAALIARMRLGGVASQLAAHSVLARFEQDELTLRLDPANQTLRTATAVERLGKAISDALGRAVRLNVEVLQVEAETPAQAKARRDAKRIDQARQHLEDDPLVRAAGEKLGARLVPESVAPREQHPQDVSD